MKRVSLQDVHISPFIRLNDVTNISLNTFMDKCVDCGNKEAININPDVALELFDKASKGGHGAATYAFALISLYLGGQYSKQGVKTIGKMKVTQKQKAITMQYRRFQQILHYIFVLHPLFDNKPLRCCTIKHVPLVRNNGLNSSENENCYGCNRGLLGQIVERVASISCKDLINLRLSCKLFNEIGRQWWVYTNLSLLDVPFSPLRLLTYENYRNFESFMNCCIECENNEALYITGVTISKMKVTQEQRKITRQCRQRLREILGTIFMFNRVFVVEPPRCCTRLLHLLTNNPIGSDSDEYEE
ncbi:hypothetical protein H5410_005052 [Solanum commersonii]|uniref:At2g35280-like TPR domain-containing protein n=1 Tax=Solanum commersonii TaxID=4109 RepID=A0A9J6A637_SOLCO|nr:hypothetical protein H5410_005052 [Solanum commersonii]